MTLTITILNFHSYNCRSCHLKNKIFKNLFLKKPFFFTFSLPPENQPEDWNSDIQSFATPDGLGSASKTTGQTEYSIYSPAKRLGQPEINFTGFLDTLI